jgi:hypothetical protein
MKIGNSKSQRLISTPTYLKIGVLVLKLNTSNPLLCLLFYYPVKIRIGRKVNGSLQRHNEAISFRYLKSNSLYWCRQPIKHHVMRACGGVEIKFHAVLTSALNIVIEWVHSSVFKSSRVQSSCYRTVKIPQTKW